MQTRTHWRIFDISGYCKVSGHRVQLSIEVMHSDGGIEVTLSLPFVDIVMFVLASPPQNSNKISHADRPNICYSVPRTKYLRVPPLASTISKQRSKLNFTLVSAKNVDFDISASFLTLRSAKMYRFPSFIVHYSMHTPAPPVSESGGC